MIALTTGLIPTSTTARVLTRIALAAAATPEAPVPAIDLAREHWKHFDRTQEINAALESFSTEEQRVAFAAAYAERNAGQPAEQKPVS